VIGRLIALLFMNILTIAAKSKFITISGKERDNREKEFVCF